MPIQRFVRMFGTATPSARLTRAIATLCAAVALGAAAPSGGDPYVFGGRIIAADSGSLDGVRVVASDARGAYEAIMDSSGVFVGSLPSAPVGRVTLRVFSDVTTPRYHTSVVMLGGTSMTSARIVIVPTTWRIRGGSFDGLDVAVDPVRATMRSSDGPGYWRLTRRGHLAGRAVSWSTDSLPVRVAFRHERNDAVIFEQDSIGFWKMAREVEHLVGRRLFRPASYEDVESGGDGILVTIDRRMSPAGRTFITFDQAGRIYEALVTVSRREYLSESRIASHELMHAIGLGHTSAWPSVMGANTGTVNAPTVQDVAYAQLYYAIARLQRDKEAGYAILEAGR